MVLKWPLLYPMGPGAANRVSSGFALLPGAECSRLQFCACYLASTELRKPVSAYTTQEGESDLAAESAAISDPLPGQVLPPALLGSLTASQKCSLAAPVVGLPSTSPGVGRMLTPPAPECLMAPAPAGQMYCRRYHC